ncbi:MAG: 16S rRNA (guanine(966)-N(2))-methyltransferase RsmD [bacterium]|nr:16S rRNA (guanine(966)-N(2))-methyltransferase RsmD [bacterium]
MIRIISGSLRGRRLSTPPGHHTRPTSDRVRTALFNILGPWIHGRRVLDLFAGAGSVGIECLSRGAAHVTFVENNPLARASLSRNLVLLHLQPHALIIPTDVMSAIPTLRGHSFDLIFADPPYRHPDLLPLLAALRDAHLASPDTVCVIEHASPSPFRPHSLYEGWRCYRSSHYGKTCLAFFDLPTNIPSSP